MDRNTVIAIVMGIFGIIVLAFLLVFKDKLIAVIKAPFGMEMKVKGSNESAQNGPAVKVENAKSKSGGLTAEDGTGRGAHVKGVEVDKDIKVSSNAPKENSSPKA